MIPGLIIPLRVRIAILFVVAELDSLVNASNDLLEHLTSIVANIVFPVLQQTQQ